MFNPKPQVQAVPLFDGHECLVVDNALEEPEAWARWTVDNQRHFAPSTSSYPGLEIALAEEATARFADFMSLHVRQRLGGRRTLGTACRLSMVTLAPEALSPRQWQCHRDDQGLPEGECVVAAVLYLFHDEALGGTRFYRPRRDAAALRRMTEDASTLDAVAFAARYPEVAPGYPGAGNAWFEHVLTVPPRWNRAIFYDGGIFHSGDVHNPARMVADPARGRLTMNAFMRCRKPAR